jgi:hypothetical protein
MSKINTSEIDHQLDGIDPTLQNTLKDIAYNVELQPNFRIYHPNYHPFELSEEIVANLRKMPPEIQQRYNCLQISGFLYGIYYNGYLLNALSLESNTHSLPTDLENSTFLGIDQDFLAQLHFHNLGSGYYDSGWSVLKEKSDSSLIVCKGGLKLHVQSDYHFQSVLTSTIVGQQISILMPKNLIEKGFYLAVGNAGSYIGIEPIIRIYFNISSEGAIALMETLTDQLNADAIPFVFKVLYNPSDYQRYDAGVLYFNSTQYEVIKRVVKAAYFKNQAYFNAKVPLFTKQLMPGLGLAEQPMVLESFGENRCQIVANALLQAIQTGDISPEARMKSICKQFANKGIDLRYPYLNPGSEDIYKFC